MYDLFDRAGAAQGYLTTTTGSLDTRRGVVRIGEKAVRCPVLPLGSLTDDCLKVQWFRDWGALCGP